MPTTIPAFDPVPRAVTERSGPGHSAAQSEHDVRIASAVNDGGAVNRSRLPHPGRTQELRPLRADPPWSFDTKTATSIRSRGRPDGWGDPHRATSGSSRRRIQRIAQPDRPHDNTAMGQYVHQPAAGDFHRRLSNTSRTHPLKRVGDVLHDNTSAGPRRTGQHPHHDRRPHRNPQVDSRDRLDRSIRAPFAGSSSHAIHELLSCQSSGSHRYDR